MLLTSWPHGGCQLGGCLYPADRRGAAIPASGELTSRQILDELAAGSTTDIFLLSHGWLADLNSAKDQYTRWMQTMAICTDDDIAHPEDAHAFWQAVSL